MTTFDGRPLRRLRWSRELLTAVCECILRFSAKRTAAMLGIEKRALYCTLGRYGVSCVRLKRAARRGA